MNYRKLGKTGFTVSEIGFGGWAIGSDWGEVNDRESQAALNKAVDLGVNFFDTADGYGDGRSEILIGQLRQSRQEKIIIATKAGRGKSPHRPQNYSSRMLVKFIDRSLKNLKTDSLDLLQLHTPPTVVYYQPEVFNTLDKLVKVGKIRNYGVSVEKAEEGLMAIQYPGVKTVQIIFNMFRQRPMELFFKEAEKKNIGIIVRVPLASGLLTGKMTKETTFIPYDHRNFNRNGEMFDKGETFAGVDFKLGLKAVEKLKEIKPKDMTMTQFALKWILMFDAVSSVIPGAKTPEQVTENVQASELPGIGPSKMEAVSGIYEKFVKKQVHLRW